MFIYFLDLTLTSHRNLNIKVDSKKAQLHAGSYSDLLKKARNTICVFKANIFFKGPPDNWREPTSHMLEKLKLIRSTDPCRVGDCPLYAQQILAAYLAACLWQNRSAVSSRHPQVFDLWEHVCVTQIFWDLWGIVLYVFVYIKLLWQPIPLAAFLALEASEVQWAKCKAM